jgi:hypothetical protein
VGANLQMGTRARNPWTKVRDIKIYSGENQQQVTKNKGQQMTKETFAKHFTELHNPVQADGISLSEETGDEYYGCSLCDNHQK